VVEALGGPNKEFMVQIFQTLLMYLMEMVALLVGDAQMPQTQGAQGAQGALLRREALVIPDKLLRQQLTTVFL